MKSPAFLILCLPMVSAYQWFTNDGWSKPARYNSQACENGNVYYFCGVEAGTKGQNPEPAAFPHGHDNCNIADGNNCVWRGATGLIICCPK
ncbi:hypothetical protein BFJ63_vAg19145 [Fusarium oxysporum f. sp. narcissi]|uniref:Uncharacterized protein n=1 Tax=Fusarium oxysporum f. sp. narcissi TaxID=451672 RepID=A0A4Q2UWI9_FUSOX|nr:hypothetical protein BFJ63_vAg19145 [Fusarium oxysporum f. sp. narcissi]